MSSRTITSYLGPLSCDNTNNTVTSVNLRDVTQISDLRKFYSSIVVKELSLTVFQLSCVGGDDNPTCGFVRFGVVPSDWTSNRVLQYSRTASGIQPFHLKTSELASKTLVCDLDVFELDLALKDRRGCQPKVICQIDGVRGDNVDIVYLEMNCKVECQGEAYGY